MITAVDEGSSENLSARSSVNVHALGLKRSIRMPRSQFIASNSLQPTKSYVLLASGSSEV